MKAVAVSYADALLALAHDSAQAGEFEQALHAFALLYRGSAELRDFLCNPVISHAAQKDALRRLAPDSAPQAVMNCLYLMVDKGRIALLTQMADAYKQHRAALVGTLLIHVNTPEPLDDAETEHIKTVFIRRFAARDAEVETTIDPALIGGVRIQIGDMLFDQSLSGRLNELRRALEGQKS